MFPAAPSPIDKIPHSRQRHAGQVGYVICNMKSAVEAKVGDTFHHVRDSVEPLPGFEPAKSMVCLVACLWHVVTFKSKTWVPQEDMLMSYLR